MMATFHHVSCHSSAKSTKYTLQKDATLYNFQSLVLQEEFAGLCHDNFSVLWCLFSFLRIPLSLLSSHRKSSTLGRFVINQERCCSEVFHNLTSSECCLSCGGVRFFSSSMSDVIQKAEARQRLNTLQCPGKLIAMKNQSVTSVTLKKIK